MALSDVPEQSSRDRSIRSAALVAVAVVGLLAAYRAFQPVAGDQALSMQIGRRLGTGEVMYLDVWDIRQPLSFYWYTLVGWTLGGSTLAVRVGEFVWQAALAWLIAHDVGRIRGSLEGAVTSIAAVGPLFWMMRANDVAQPDTLAMLPIYLVFRSTLLPGRDPLRFPWPIVIGLSSVGLALVKITLAPLPILFVAVHIAVHRPGWRDILRAAAVILTAIAAGAMIVVIYFVSHGDWGWVRHTWFEQAPAMRSLAPPRPRRLLESWSRVVIFAAPVVVAAGVGAWRIRRHADTWSLGAACWLIASSLLLLPQQWWAYQWLAITVPLGLLAGRPLTELLRRRELRVAAVLFVVVAMLASDRAYTRALIEHGPDRSAIALDLQSATQERDEARAFLAPSTRMTGDVYVFANPLVLQDLGREQRIAIHGWSPEFYDDTTWRRLLAELETDPPAYLIIDEFSNRIVRDRAPNLETWVMRNYEPVHTLSSGAVIVAARG